MKRKLFLFTLAALLFGYCGANADDDLIWTKNLDPHHICGVYFAYGDSVAVAVAHGGIFQYDANTGELLKSKEITNPPYYAYFTNKIPGHNKVLTSNEILCLWDLEKNDTLWTKKNFIAYCAPSNLEPVIYALTTSSENKELIKLDLFTGEEIERRKVKNNQKTQEIYISPNDKILLMHIDHGVEFYDLEKDKTIYTLEWYGEPYSVSFSPDGKYVAAGGEKKVRIWNLETMKIEKIIDVPSNCFAVKFSQDSKYFLYGDNHFDYYNIKLLSVSDWKTIKQYPHFSNFIDLAKDFSTFVGNTAEIYMINSFLGFMDTINNSVLFPNPTTKIVNIKLEQLSIEPINISIYDEMGSLITTIFDGIAEQADFVWSTEAVNSGVYFCKIERRSSVSTYKIIVNR